MQDEHMKGAHLKQREPMKAGKRKSKPSSWAGKGGSRSAAQVHMGDPSLTLQQLWHRRLPRRGITALGEVWTLSKVARPAKESFWIVTEITITGTRTSRMKGRRRTSTHQLTDPKGQHTLGTDRVPRLSIWQTQLHICFLKNWGNPPVFSAVKVCHKSLHCQNSQAPNRF